MNFSSYSDPFAVCLNKRGLSRMQESYICICVKPIALNTDTCQHLFYFAFHIIKINAFSTCIPYLTIPKAAHQAAYQFPFFIFLSARNKYPANLKNLDIIIEVGRVFVSRLIVLLLTDLGVL